MRLGSGELVVIIIILKIITLFQEGNIFGTSASLTYGPQLQLQIDCCCVKMALQVSKLHIFVTSQDTDMYDTSF